MLRHGVEIDQGKAPHAPVGYRDSQCYFTTMERNIRKWFMRLMLNHQPFWASFRHIKTNAARALCSGLEIIDGGSYGESRIVRPSIADLEKAKPLVVAAFEAEMARVAAPSEGTSAPA